MSNKPAESFIEIVKAHPYTKCWKLFKLINRVNIKDNVTQSVPESVSVLIET